MGRDPSTANASALEYLPGPKSYLWMRVDGTWSYDPAADTWTEKKPNGGTLKHADPSGHTYEAVTVYVPQQKIVVSTGSNRPTDDRKDWVGRTNVYSVEANTWKKVAEGEGVPWGDTAGTPFVYDSVAGVCLLCRGRLNDFWAFDVIEAKWRKFAPKGPPLPGDIRPASYYDVERNVWVIYRGGKIWVYRHKSVKNRAD